MIVILTTGERYDVQGDIRMLAHAIQCIGNGKSVTIQTVQIARIVQR